MSGFYGGRDPNGLKGWETVAENRMENAILVVQVLVNLIRNAKYACDDSGGEEKQITLRVANGNRRIRVSVTLLWLI